MDDVCGLLAGGVIGVLAGFVAPVVVFLWVVNILLSVVLALLPIAGTVGFIWLMVRLFKAILNNNQ